MKSLRQVLLNPPKKYDKALCCEVIIYEEWEDDVARAVFRKYPPNAQTFNGKKWVRSYI